MNRTRYDGKLADVWSSGVMLYAMLCCRYPFERPEDDDDPKGQHRIVQRIIKCAPAHMPLVSCLSCLYSMHACMCGCALHALIMVQQSGRGWKGNCRNARTHNTGAACHVTVTSHLCHAGQYEWPKDKPLSAECKDLMSKIFVADPAARISIAQIQVHSSASSCWLMSIHSTHATAQIAKLCLLLAEHDMYRLLAVVHVQKHPWFRHGLPQNLEVDTYNGHYVKLSKQAADNAGNGGCVHPIGLSRCCSFTVESEGLFSACMHSSSVR